MVRIVVTMTTLPNRYHYLHQPLNSIHKQTIKPDAIYVTLPKKAKRSGLVYPPLPDNIKALCTPIYIDIDYGPICKMVGALLSENDPNTLILSIDDDIYYPSNMIEIFLEKHKIKKNVVITGTGVLISCGVGFGSINTTFKDLTKYNGLLGFDMPGGKREVSIIQGFSGVLYKRAFFPDYDRLLKLAISDEDLFKSDDIVISAYLCQQDIKIYTFYNMPLIPSAFNSPDALSSNIFEMLKTFNRTVQKCQKLGMFKRFAPSSITDSPTFKIPLLILCLLLIFGLSIYILFILLNGKTCSYHDNITLTI